MHRALHASLAFLLVLATACQSSPLKDFKTLHFGMEKDEVLEAMGNPRRTQRFHGKDRWTYVFYDQSIRFEKEIQFFEGNAIYVGDTWQPPAENSAYYVDHKNEERNRTLDEQLKKEIAENKNAYQNYESQVRGEGKTLYVPTFTPIQ